MMPTTEDVTELHAQKAGAGRELKSPFATNALYRRDIENKQTVEMDDEEDDFFDNLPV